MGFYLIKMKILLLNPPSKNNIIRRWRCAVEQGHYLYPPLELCYVSSILKKNNLEVRIIDSVAEKIGQNETKERIKKINPDVIIFITGFESINEDIEFVIGLKDISNSKIICFGHFSSLYYEKLLDKYPLDYCVVGEPEYTIRDLCIAFKDKKSVETIKGIAYKNEDKVVFSGNREIIQNLDDLPFPDREGIKNDLYFEAFPDPKPFTTILTSRGCPFNCSYCVKTYGNNFRQRTVDNVIAEIKECVRKYNIKSLRILDDTFTVSDDWVKEFCEKILKEGIKLKWTCLARPETLKKEIIPIMKKAGCVRMMIGVESGSQKILKTYNRNYDISKLKPAFDELKRNKIQSFAFFMVGAPDELEEDVEESLKVAKSLDPDFVTVNVMRVYPGTMLFDQLSEKGEANFSLTPYSSEFKAELSSERVQKLMLQFYRKFYFRPEYIIKHMPIFISSPIYTAKLGIEYMKWVLKRTNMGNIYKNKNIATKK